MGKFSIKYKESFLEVAWEMAWAIVTQLKSGGNTDVGFWQGLANAETAVLEKRVLGSVRVAMRERGFEIGDEELITKEVLTREVSRKTGIEFSDVTNHEAVISDIDKYATGKINVALSANLVSVMDRAALKTGIVDIIVAQVGSGGLGAVMNGARASMLRTGIIYGVAFDGKQTFDVSREHRKMMQRIYQKRYRRTHKKVWID